MAQLVRRSNSPWCGVALAVLVWHTNGPGCGRALDMVVQRTTCHRAGGALDMLVRCTCVLVVVMRSVAVVYISELVVVLLTIG